MISRHKIGFGFTVALAVLIVGFAISMIVFSTRVASERDRAEEEAAKAKAINAFLQDTLGSANPIEGSDRDITVLEALETATSNIEEAFANQPEVETEVRHTIGVTYLRLGHYDKAEDMLRSALKVARKTYTPDHPELAVPLTSLAVLLHERGNLEEAELLYRKALDIRQKHFGREDEGVASILSNLGILLQDRGDYDAAEPIFKEALSIGLEHLGDKNQDLAKLRSRYGECLLKLRKYEEAEAELLSSLPILMDTLGEQNKRTQQTILFLVELYKVLDKEDEAEKYRKLLAPREQ